MNSFKNKINRFECDILTTVERVLFALDLISTVGEFRIRENKHSHVECIVYMVTGRTQSG